MKMHYNKKEFDLRRNRSTCYSSFNRIRPSHMTCVHADYIRRLSGFGGEAPTQIST